MRLSLRFILPLLVVLAAFAYAVVPLADRLTLRWFVRDLDIRSNLIANTLHEPVQDQLRTGDRARTIQLFSRITQDERLYALGFCASPADRPLATPTLPPGIRCDSLDAYATPTGRLLTSPDGPLLVSVKRLDADGAPDGRLILVHDMSFVERRSQETRRSSRQSSSNTAVFPNARRAAVCAASSGMPAATFS